MAMEWDKVSKTCIFCQVHDRDLFAGYEKWMRLNNQYLSSAWRLKNLKMWWKAIDRKQIKS